MVCYTLQPEQGHGKLCRAGGLTFDWPIRTKQNLERSKNNGFQRFEEVIHTVHEKLQSAFVDLERVGVKDEELADAKRDGMKLLDLISDYAKLTSDATPWVEKALDLKNEFGRKALEYFAKLTD